ncbi:ribonuclease YeeF family protein [Bhargavaea beijingensis]|nr:T7SS effector LXG polymorphic toxin [Bhargavaea beijingensis]
MKVLNAEELHAGLNRNMEMLHRLEVEMQSIEKAMKELTQLEESLKGEGGNAIRSFYEECHVPFLQFFQLFSEQFNQVLQQMEAALYSLEPDSQGYILEQFLEGELEQRLTLMGRLTSNLTDETNSIMDQVNDIVGLPHLDDSGVQEGVIHSKRKRDDTVTQLYEFDATQTNALQPAEQDIQTMKTWLADLEGLFKDGLTDIHFQTTQWAALTSCNPLLTHLASFSEVDSMEVEDKETIIDTGIEVVKGAGTGLFDAGKDFVTGLWDTITNPKATVDGIANAFSNPGDTYNTIKTAISESYERDMVNGDANSRAHWVTYALGTVATSIVGTKGANALVKTGTTAAKASVPTIVSATNHASASLANLLPYTPRSQLAMAGGIPYNVVNGVQLKDQLITMAKAESGVSGVTEKVVTKGTGKYQVGAYKDIKGVEGLDAHHVGQKAAMKKLVDNYDLNTAPAINVPKVGHTIKGPNGIVSRSTKGIDNPRQLLARDIMELRRVYDDMPNSALKELIELNKKMYPEMRK